MSERIAKHIKLALSWGIALCFLVFPMQLVAQDVEEDLQGVAIIAHPDVTAEQLGRRDLVDLYTLEINKWIDGSLVVLYDLKSNTATKQIFYDYLRQTRRELKKIWMRVVLSGEGRAPRAVGSEEELLRKVANTAGALGYVSTHLFTDDVQVLGIIGEDGQFIAATRN